MRKIVFPPIESATEDGLVAVGGDLHIDTLETAYRQGIFPWPISPEFPLAWFAPDPRGIIPFDAVHLPKSLQKLARKAPFEIRFNTSFTEIVRQCAIAKRTDQPTTWITPAIIEGYSKLFQHGNAWCAGAWDGQRLVGGLYGVSFDRFRSGESMFTTEDNAGKLCLLAAIERFRTEGVTFLDTQMVTPVVKTLGGREVPRHEFMQYLKAALD